MNNIPFSVGAKYSLDRAMINAFLFMREHSVPKMIATNAVDAYYLRLVEGAPCVEKSFLLAPREKPKGEMRK